MIRKIYDNDKLSACIFILGMLLSVIWVFLVNTQPFSDFKYYHAIAQNVAMGLSWGNTYTSVGYPILLGGLYKLFGANIIVGKVLNLFLTAFSFIMFYLILKKLDITLHCKRIVYALFVFMPYNIAYNSLLASEIFFSFLVLVTTYFYFSTYKYKYYIVGIIVGINTMVKPFFIVFFFAIFLLELLNEKKFFKPFKNSMIILIVASIVISPWIYRNSKMMGELTYVSNNSGIVLYINNNSQNNSGRWMAASDVKNSITLTDDYKKANMTDQNKLLSKSAKQWIKDHPKEFTVLGFKRLFNTYFVGDDILYTFNDVNIKETIKSAIFSFTQSYRRCLFGISIAYILMYSLIVIVKILRNKTETIDKFTLYLAILFYMFTSIYFVTEGQGRYAFPVIFISVYFVYCFFKELFLKIIELRR